MDSAAFYKYAAPSRLSQIFEAEVFGLSLLYYMFLLWFTDDKATLNNWKSTEISLKNRQLSI
jgi:hypothetical protein